MVLGFRNLTKCHFSISKLLNLIEDPRYPCLGPHIWMLNLGCLWNSKINKFKKFTLYFAICFFISQYVKCVIKHKPSGLKLILRHTSFHLGIVKACFFLKNYKKWENLIDYISTIERNQIAEGNIDKMRIITEYIKRDRRITYFFWALGFIAILGIFTEPYLLNEKAINGTAGVYVNVIDGYIPYGVEPPGYYIAMFIQTVLGFIVSAVVLGWDTLVCAIMICLCGQLKIMRWNCANMIDVNDTEKSRSNIAECHRKHVTLVMYQRLFNSLISPPMFIYLIVVSIYLGISIMEIVKLADDLNTLISSFVYLCASLTQLLLFYWHSNDVDLQSTLVSYGVFESDWVGMDVRCQREVILLGYTTRTRLVFNAGPFNEMTLATFIGILRLTYSLFTLLNSTSG
uniref:Odorant receptor n=1 Tax=Conogethes pinicolalis TaxID=1178461 RepID=A0A5B9GDB3_9NEOP|nr:odorant receptor 20 [Conogethes pinicolalis]